MLDPHSLKKALPHFKAELIDRLAEVAVQKIIPANAVLLREGQYVQVVPLVLSGLIKVFARHDDRELLLYYIQAGESCIMSFSAGLGREPSKVVAIAEEETHALLLPVDQAALMTEQYPDMNKLFFHLFSQRYAELLDTIGMVLFNKMDQRLYEYLLKKSRLAQNRFIKTSHRQIASELGTAREVVTRVMKKLEMEGKVIQHASGIEIVER